MVWSLFSHGSNSEIGDRGGQPTGPDLSAAEFFMWGYLKATWSVHSLVNGLLWSRRRVSNIHFNCVAKHAASVQPNPVCDPDIIVIRPKRSQQSEQPLTSTAHIRDDSPGRRNPYTLWTKSLSAPLRSRIQITAEATVNVQYVRLQQVLEVILNGHMAGQSAAPKVFYL
jgi:hypothetical protein